jgi:hypothetical protein
MLPNVPNYLPFLLCLVQAQDWTAFEVVALLDHGTFKFISKSICKCKQFNGVMLLHACMRFDPPVYLLLKMIDLYPQALLVKDCIGRTPLHVAAGSGVSSLVMKILIAKYPEACNIQDLVGRTPLHFACDTSSKLFEQDGEYSRGPLTLDTVRVLLSGSLDVTLEDANGMDTVKYALLLDTLMEVVTFLQKAAQQVMSRENQLTLPVTHWIVSDQAEDCSHNGLPSLDAIRVLLSGFSCGGVSRCG